MTKNQNHLCGEQFWLNEKSIHRSVVKITLVRSLVCSRKKPTYIIKLDHPTFSCKNPLEGPLFAFDFKISLYNFFYLRRAVSPRFVTLILLSKTVSKVRSICGRGGISCCDDACLNLTIKRAIRFWLVYLDNSNTEI